MIDKFWNLENYAFNMIEEPEFPVPYGSVNVMEF